MLPCACCRAHAAQAHHYEALGVTTGASSAEVKKSFHRLALKLHPDKNQQPYAEEALQPCREARWGPPVVGQISARFRPDTGANQAGLTSARGCPMLPQAPASLGQSATCAALAGHMHMHMHMHTCTCTCTCTHAHAHAHALGRVCDRPSSALRRRTARSPTAARGASTTPPWASGPAHRARGGRPTARGRTIRTSSRCSVRTCGLRQPATGVPLVIVN